MNPRTVIQTTKITKYTKKSGKAELSGLAWQVNGAMRCIALPFLRELRVLRG
jgi:hypothetical protein